MCDPGSKIKHPEGVNQAGYKVMGQWELRVSLLRSCLKTKKNGAWLSLGFLKSKDQAQVIY